MSQKQWKKHRRELMDDYRWELNLWFACEPPRWRFISHWLWKKDKPVLPKRCK